jgi:hypothetical protein
MRQTFGGKNSLFVAAGLMARLALYSVINRAASGNFNNNNNNNNNNVAYLLKSRKVEQEKQPLVANSRQRLGKQVPTVRAIIKALLERVFTTRSVSKSYKGDNWGNRVNSVWECVMKRGSWKGAAVQRGLGRVKLKNVCC